MKIRINNIGAEKAAYIGKPPKDADLNVSIVKYHPNRYYGELENYLKDGWKDCVLDGIDFIKRKNGRGSVSISKKCFQNKETNYVIAFLKYEKDGGSTQLTSVGDRLLYIENEDKKDFWEVYRLADKEMMRRFCCNEQRD